MKLMINGAVTIGTLDGANVEIHEQVGDENIFLFGMKAHEVEELWQRGYHPTEFVTPELQAVLDMLTSGVLGQRFDDLVDSLLTNRFGTADPYMTLADFQDYARAQRDVAAVYQDKQHFARMSLINIAKAGIFSSDRAVKEYADEIWASRLRCVSCLTAVRRSTRPRSERSGRGSAAFCRSASRRRSAPPASA